MEGEVRGLKAHVPVLPFGMGFGWGEHVLGVESDLTPDCPHPVRL